MPKRKPKPTPAKSRRSVQSAQKLRQSDFAEELQGRNKLQGDDQFNVHNERNAMPRVGGASGQGRSRRKQGR